MDSQFRQMIQVNIKGRVFVICQSRGITDPSIIGYYNQILEEATVAMLPEGSTIADFHRALDEQVAWLESEIERLSDTSSIDAPAAPPRKTLKEEAAEKEEAEKRLNAEKKAVAYVPEAKTMPERLKDQRAEMEQLLVNDCVTLKLVSPTQARKFKHELGGQDPEKAEEELVARLRSVLYSQMAKFIRKHNGGPWVGAAEQTEVRMQISRTSTLAALVNLSRQLLHEREEWMSKTKTSLVGRLFSGRVKLDK